MDVLSNYIDGRFVAPAANEVESELVSTSCADLSDVVGRFPVSVAAVDAAIQAAQRAKRAWGELPQGERNAAILRIRAEIAKRETTFAELIGREVGKPKWEALTEVKAMVAKADVTLNEGLKLISAFNPTGLNGECRFRPHGVLAVIGPFNFPGHLPNGHILPALAAGNCVIFKPSEVTPGVGQLYAEAVHAAGLPAGVFSLVQGAKSVGERLSVASGIDGLLFTGSHAVGSAIQRANADNPGKILALELGGKNCSLVLEDADFDKAIYDVLFSAYVTAGQRCSATSRALVHKDLVDRFTGRMTELVKKLKVGHWSQADVFMGPLSTEAGLRKFLGGCAKAKEEGAEVLIEPGTLELDKRGHYARPGLHRVTRVMANSAYQREELFGPDLAIYSIDDLDHGIALANSVDYGLTAAVFTKDPARFEVAARRIEAGVINWNAPTVGSSSRLPFGGLKRSGNHRPAGLFSTLYCAYPIAITKGESALDRRTVAPGVVWE
jgi:succinylglutamic semialdehyde dehydrogenase